MKNLLKSQNASSVNYVVLIRACLDSSSRQMESIEFFLHFEISIARFRVELCKEYPLFQTTLLFVFKNIDISKTFLDLV